MPLPFEEVITPVTAAEVKQEILDLCATGGLPTTSWQSGSVIRTIIAVMSNVIAIKSEVEVEIAKAGFGDLASPDWATIFAQAIYDVIRVLAEPATGTVTLTNTSLTNYSKNPGELIVAQDSGGAHPGVTYRNQDAIVIPASGTLADVAVASDITGTQADASPNTVTILVSSLVGVTVTNPDPILGADDETTTALILRTRAKLASLSPLGPKDAYNYVVTTPFSSFPAIAGQTIDDASSPITRSSTTSDPTTGFLSVYIANAEGAPVSGDVDLAQEAVDKWAEPLCDTATVIAASELSIDVTYTVNLQSSMTSAQVESLISLALSTYFAMLPIGGVVIPSVDPDNGYVFREPITQIIHDAVPGVKLVSLSVPSSDTLVAANEVPVLGTVTATINFL